MCGCRAAAIALAISLRVSSVYASSINVSDGFEGTMFDSFWTLVQQNGTIALFTAQSQGGAQSASFTSNNGSVNGGQREIHLRHVFGSLLTGTASIYFYDAAPGTQTEYEQFNLVNSITGQVFSVGTMDFDANCYEAHIDNSGPGANCGSSPMPSTTNITRTLGWHLLGISIQPGVTTLSIDNIAVFTAVGNYNFDTVDIAMTAPGFRPVTTAYFDTFTIAADPAAAAVPEPTTMMLVGAGAIGVCARKRRRPNAHPAEKKWM